MPIMPYALYFLRYLYPHDLYDTDREIAEEYFKSDNGKNVTVPGLNESMDKDEEEMAKTEMRGTFEGWLRDEKKTMSWEDTSQGGGSKKSKHSRKHIFKKRKSNKRKSKKRKSKKKKKKKTKRRRTRRH